MGIIIFYLVKEDSIDNEMIVLKNELIQKDKNNNYINDILEKELPLKYANSKDRELIGEKIKYLGKELMVKTQEEHNELKVLRLKSTYCNLYKYIESESEESLLYILLVLRTAESTLSQEYGKLKKYSLYNSNRFKNSVKHFPAGASIDDYRKACDYYTNYSKY